MHWKDDLGLWLGLVLGLGIVAEFMLLHHRYLGQDCCHNHQEVEAMAEMEMVWPFVDKRWHE